MLFLKIFYNKLLLTHKNAIYFICTVWWILVILYDCVTTTTRKICNSSLSLENFSHASLQLILSPFWAPAITALLSITIALPFPECHLNETHCRQFLCLIFFTQHNEIYPCCFVYWYCVTFYYLVLFHCMDITQFIQQLMNIWTTSCFLLLWVILQ